MTREELIDTIKAEYLTALKDIAPRGGGLHRSLFLPACKGVKLGLTFEQIVSDIKSHSQGTLQKNEVENTVRSAFKKTEILSNHRVIWKPRSVRKKLYEIPELSLSEANRWAEKFINIKPQVSRSDFSEISARPVEQVTSADFIEALFAPGEELCIGGLYTTGTAKTEDHAERLRQGASHPLIWVSPFTGEYSIQDSGKASQRLKAFVADRRYCCIEFDNLEIWPLRKQSAFWYGIVVQKALPVCAVIYSGGKSIHAWLKIDARDDREWNKLVSVQFFDERGGIFQKLGADSTAKQPMHGSRLPGHVRQETGRTQNLLYLNPGVASLRYLMESHWGSGESVLCDSL